jgi:hypothetical protein
VLTLFGRVNYERMALSPSTAEDATKLKKLGIDGYVYPLDEALGLDNLPYKMTIGLMLEIAKECTRCESYEESEKILKEKLKIQINDDSMRRVTNTLGTIIFDKEMSTAERIWNDFKSANLIFSESKIDHTLYIEVDGAMIPIRQDDNKGSHYKENKLAMVFSSDNIFYWTDKHGVRQHRIRQRDYSSYIGDSDIFTKLVLSLAVKNGYGRYKNTVLLSDGATWIRNMKNYIFPDAQQILDFYHLKEHITDFGKIIFDLNEKLYLPWAKEVSDLFKKSKFEQAISLIIKSTKNKFKDNLNKLLNYLDHNKENIDYANYLSKGFFIGSGAIESSNKTVLQRRLKYGAMRWNLTSAQAVVTLVAKVRSDRWNSDVIQNISSYYNKNI